MRPILNNLSERFWLKVWPRGDCWEYRGCRSGGYGVFSVGDENVGAHRWAFTEVKGTIPNHLELDHRCNHPWCVKPSHLVAVTSRENNLRGMGWSGRNVRKTHCKHGHAFIPANTRVRPYGRGCMECRRLDNLKINRRRRAERRALRDRAPQPTSSEDV